MYDRKPDMYQFIMDEVDELIAAAKTEGRELSLQTALEIIKIQALRSAVDYISKYVC